METYLGTFLVSLSLPNSNCVPMAPVFHTTEWVDVQVAQASVCRLWHTSVQWLFVLHIAGAGQLWLACLGSGTWLQHTCCDPSTAGMCWSLHRDTLNLQLLWVLLLGFQGCQPVSAALALDCLIPGNPKSMDKFSLSTWKCLGVNKGCLGKSDAVALVWKGMFWSSGVIWAPVLDSCLRGFPPFTLSHASDGGKRYRITVLEVHGQVLPYSWSHLRSFWGSQLRRGLAIHSWSTWEKARWVKALWSRNAQMGRYHR